MSFLVDTKNNNDFLLHEYPDAIIIDRLKLAELHHQYGTSPVIDGVIMRSNDSGNAGTAYILPPGTYGAEMHMCCNGIRYGAFGDYISLPQLPATIFEK